MSANAESDLAKRRAQTRARNEYTQKHGEAWLQRLQGEFARLPKGTVVVINCRTGEYVRGPTLSEATDEFERRFDQDIGYAHQIGGGFFLGGGIV